VQVGTLALALAARCSCPSMAAEGRPSSGRVLAKVMPFVQARAMARSMGLTTKEEWDDYACPGTYRLPSAPDSMWATEWQGWDDWLGAMLPWDEACTLARSLGLPDQQAYLAMRAATASTERADKDAWNGAHALRLRQPNLDVCDLERLPAKPDVFYKKKWTNWNDFLGVTS